MPWWCWCCLVLCKTGHCQKELYLLKSRVMEMSLKEGEVAVWTEFLAMFRPNQNIAKHCWFSFQNCIYTDRKTSPLTEDGLQMLKVVNPRAELSGGWEVGVCSMQFVFALGMWWMANDGVTNIGKIPLILIIIDGSNKISSVGRMVLGHVVEVNTVAPVADS